MNSKIVTGRSGSHVRKVLGDKLTVLLITKRKKLRLRGRKAKKIECNNHGQGTRKGEAQGILIGMCGTKLVFVTS